MELNKASFLDPKFLPFLFPLHKVIFWVWIGKGSFTLFLCLGCCGLVLMLLENESRCLKRKVWVFEVLSFEIRVFDYLTNIDEKFLFVKSFCYCLCIGINRKGYDFVLGWFGSHERKLYKILKFYRICVQWLVSLPLTSFTSTDQFQVHWQFHIQWLVLHPLTSFVVDVIYVHFHWVNYFILKSYWIYDDMRCDWDDVVL